MAIPAGSDLPAVPRGHHMSFAGGPCGNREPAAARAADCCPATIDTCPDLQRVRSAADANPCCWAVLHADDRSKPTAGPLLLDPR